MNDSSSQQKRRSQIYVIYLVPTSLWCSSNYAKNLSVSAVVGEGCLGTAGTDSVLVGLGFTTSVARAVERETPCLIPVPLISSGLSPRFSKVVRAGLPGS